MENDNGDKYRLQLGFWLIIFGLCLVTGLILVLVFLAKSMNVTDVTAVVGILTGILGTLVGTFFGVQAGSEGKRNAELQARKMSRRLETLAAHVGEEAYKKARELDPKAWD
jgi:hypothetical protein